VREKEETESACPHYMWKGRKGKGAPACPTAKGRGEKKKEKKHLGQKKKGRLRAHKRLKEGGNKLQGERGRLT